MLLYLWEIKQINDHPLINYLVYIEAVGDTWATLNVRNNWHAPPFSIFLLFSAVCYSSLVRTWDIRVLKLPCGADWLYMEFQFTVFSIPYQQIVCLMHFVPHQTFAKMIFIQVWSSVLLPNLCWHISTICRSVALCETIERNVYHTSLFVHVHFHQTKHQPINKTIATHY